MTDIQMLEIGENRSKFVVGKTLKYVKLSDGGILFFYLEIAYPRHSVQYFCNLKYSENL